MRLVFAVCAVLLVAAPVAHAGPPIKRLDPCAEQNATYATPSDGKAFKAAVVCLISEIRASQGLPALKADAKLAKSAQGHATNQARAGALSHGKSVAEIPKRIARAGYRAAALNEGLGIGTSDETAYDIVGRMMEQGACSQILDPRFRDTGIGVSLGKLRGSPGSNYVHLVVHFGLKAGKKAPSTKRTPASTCPHRLPAPGRLVPEGDGPVAKGATVTVRVRCSGASACEDDLALELPGGAPKQTQRATADAGKTADVTFTFTEEQVAKALAGAQPTATVETGGRRYSAPLIRG